VARMDAYDAGGRTTQGAVVEEQISAHAVVFFKEGGESSAFHNNQFRKVIFYRILRPYIQTENALTVRTRQLLCP
jgi:hypothetical protein